MLELVVVAADALEEVELLELAHRVAGASGVGVRRVPADGRSDAARLDDALFARPLADQLVVVGREAPCDLGDLGDLGDLRFLTEVLSRRWDLAAVTTGGDTGPSVDEVIAFGGAFRAGPLCQAGGFTGDGERSLHDRLADLGFRSAVRRPPAWRRGAGRFGHTVPAGVVSGR